MHALSDKHLLDEPHLAGDLVPAGVYCNTETGRQICLEQDDYLPASMDGKVAVYVCVKHTWAQHEMAEVPHQTRAQAVP